MRTDQADISGYPNSDIPYGQELEGQHPSNASIALAELTSPPVSQTAQPKASSDFKRSHENISETPPAKPANDPMSTTAVINDEAFRQLNLEESFSDARQGGESDVQMGEMTSHDATIPLDAITSILN
jgi:hypothetical protein